MRVVINGTGRDVAEAASLDDVLADYGVPERGVAVAVDGSVVPRADWARTRLADGASVEVLTAVQGG
ncbi:sulfur carrier protein ThiS [Salinifilum aidingensis]